MTVMFKDYYLILGISKDATPEEIGKAIKDAEAMYNDTESIDYRDVQEAISVLSHDETRLMYNNELEAYNNTDDFENYEIKDKRLADIINKLQTIVVENEESSFNSGCTSKLGKGCLWIVIAIVVMMLQMCITAIMKQQGRNAVRNRYSYVIPQTQKVISHVYKLL